MYSSLLPYIFSRPSVYVISDSQLADYKRQNAEAEIVELDRLITSHKEAIERLERTKGDIRKDYPKLEPTKE